MSFSQQAVTGLISDEEVVERVLRGETALFEIIMRRYNQRLFRVTRSILGNTDEAQDVMQDAYVRAYMHLGQFEGRARFSTWLTKIAVHEALARHRANQRLVDLETISEMDQRAMLFVSPKPNPEEETQRQSLGAILERAVDSLPEGYRSVFMMREIEGMSTFETAESLELSEEAVKVRLHRARAMLREAIYRQTGEATASAFQFLGERCDLMVASVMKRISS